MDPPKFKTVITTKKPYKALLEIANYLLNKNRIPRIMITGSYGKTTTKEFLSMLLSEKYNVLKTIGNFNNRVGIPLSIFEMRDNDNMGVFEVGMNHSGEIKEIVDSLPPDYAIITNIGPVHMENFSSLRDIARAKLEILENNSPHMLALINGRASFLKKEFPKKYRGRAIFYNYRIQNNRLYIKELKESYDFKEQYHYLAENVTPCIILARKLGISYDACQEALNNPPNVSGRLNIIRKNGFTIIDDCYNSNPISLKQALIKSQEFTGRKIYVLGDMLELGRKTKYYHTKIGRFISENPPDYLFTIGKWSYCLGKESKVKNWKHFKDKNDIINEINKIKEKGDVFLFKASRAFQLEEIMRQCFTF